MTEGLQPLIDEDHFAVVAIEKALDGSACFTIADDVASHRDIRIGKRKCCKISGGFFEISEIIFRELLGAKLDGYGSKIIDDDGIGRSSE